MACETEALDVVQAQENLNFAVNDMAVACVGDPGSVECHVAKSTAAAMRAGLADAKRALSSCKALAAAPHIKTADGLVELLRVHRFGTGWGGGATNVLRAEVIFKLDSLPGLAFGFELRGGDRLPAHEGMLALVRDAFLNDLRLHLDYLQGPTPPNQNCTALRVWLERRHSNSEANLTAGVGPE